MGQLAQVLVVLAVVAGVIWVIPQWSCGCGSPDHELKANLHGIRLAVERYRQDKGTYPARIEELKTSGYMLQFPHNRYNRDDLTPREMQVVQPTALDGYAGNFHYEVFTALNGEPGYRLTLFGKDRRRWKTQPEPASKHVMLVLTSSAANIESARQ